MRKADAPRSRVGVLATVVSVWRVPVRAPHQVASVIREEGCLLSDPGGSSGGGPEQQSRPSCSWKAHSEQNRRRSFKLICHGVRRERTGRVWQEWEKP